MQSSDKTKRRKRRGRAASRNPSSLAPVLSIAAEVGVALSVIFAPLLLGSVPRWSVAIGLLLAGLAFVSASTAFSLEGKKLPVHPLALALGMVVAFEAIQLVPLPPGLLSLVSPRAAELYEFTLAGSAHWPAWRPLSLDPVGTGVVLARHGTWFLLLITASALATKRGVGKRLILTLAWSAAVVVVVAFGHKLAGLDQIYGIYPTRPSGWLFASFVNPNHLGAHLDLLAPVCLGLALIERSRSKKAIWSLIFVLAGAACLLTLSRGAIVALVAGLTVMAVLRRRSRLGQVFGLGAAEGEPGPMAAVRPDLRSRLRAAAAVLGPPLLVGGTLAVGAYLALEPILSEVSTLFDQSRMADEVRWSIWSGALPLIRDFWATGVGAGAFAITYPIYKTIPGHVTFSHAENQLVQTGAELGLVAGILVVGLLAWAWVSAARRQDLSAAHAGLLAGLFGLAVHELGDFATSFGGVAVPAAVALGVLMAGSLGRSSRKASPKEGPRRSRAHRMLGLFPSIVLAVAVLGVGAAGLLRARGASANEMLEQLVFGVEDGGPVDRLTLAAMALRPTDHMLALVAARAALERGDAAAAMRWVNVAVYLAPTEARAHLLAAEVLARAGREEQALLQYRLAAEWGERAHVVLSMARARYPSVEQLASALPDTADRRREVVRFLSSLGRHQDAWAFGTSALEREPEDFELLALHAGTASRLGRHAEAESLAAALVSARPRSGRGYALLAGSRLATGRVEDAISTLEEALRMLPGDPDLSLQQAHALIHRRKDPDAGLAVLDTMRLPANDRSRARMHTLRADAHAAKGRTRQALDEYRTAARLQPDDPAAWISMGDYLMAARQFERALENYREARRRSRSENQRLEEKLRRAEERVEALRAYRTRERIVGDGSVDLPVREDDAGG